MEAVVLESNFHRAFGLQISRNHSAGGKLPQELRFYGGDPGVDWAPWAVSSPQARSGFNPLIDQVRRHKCPPFKLAESSALCQLLPLLGSVRGKSVLGDSQALPVTAAECQEVWGGPFP